MKYVNIIILFFIFATLIYCSMIYTTIQHENVHEKIAQYFGCENTTIEINYLTVSGTMECTDTNHKFNKDEYTLHAENEIMSYNLDGLGLTIIVCTLFIVVVMLVKKEL